MTQFIISDVFMVAAATVLYIIASALPRIEDDPNEEKPLPFLTRIMMSDVPHRIDTVMNAFLGKFFRKLKVVLMRFDNYLTEKLKSIGAEANGKPKIDFKDLGGNGNGISHETPREEGSY